MRMLPGTEVPREPLGGASLSRVQLRVRALGTEAIEVQNVGRCPMRYLDEAVSRVRLLPGQGVVLDYQLALLAVAGPQDLPDPGPIPWSVTFGEEDALGLVGESAATWHLRKAIAEAAGRSDHTLVVGEPGTGRLTVALAIHDQSERASKTAITESARHIGEDGGTRLFGRDDAPGLIASADESSLVLQHLDQLPPSQQAMLVRTLSSGQYRPIGAHGDQTADLRFLGTTDRADDIDATLADRVPGRVHVPSMMERVADIPLLVRSALRQLARERVYGIERFFPGGDPSATPRVNPDVVLALCQHVFTDGIPELAALLGRCAECSTGKVLQLVSDLEPEPPTQEFDPV